MKEYRSKRRNPDLEKDNVESEVVGLAVQTVSSIVLLSNQLICEHSWSVAWGQWKVVCTTGNILAFGGVCAK